jgi:uncharacterized protein YabE (DUF348 family)/3D (Asp-Asp-Asp) domain-containing protein
VIVAVAVCGFRLFPTKDVTVLTNGSTVQVATTFDPRGEGLEAAGVDLLPGDIVRFSGGGRHTSLAVQRAQPVRIEADGVITDVRTQAASVEGALADAGITLQPEDRVYLDGHLTTPRGPLAASVAASRQAFVPVSERDSSGALPVSVNIVRARPVTLVVDTMRVDVKSSAPTVQSLLADLGMTVREGDLVQPALETPLSAGMTVRLAKGRTVTVVIDSKEQSLYTLARTVGDVFRLLGVTIGPEDTLSVPTEAFVTNGMTVNLGRTLEADEDVLETIEPPLRYETDPTLPLGQTRTIQGATGQKKTRYHVVYKGGLEQSRVALAAPEVLVQPVATRIIQGTKGNLLPQPPAVSVSNPAPASTGPTAADAGGGVITTKPGRTVTVWATWYNESHGGKYPGEPGYGVTASGRILEKGVCAVDRSFIKLGTYFYVPGYGTCVAGDTGGGIIGAHIDLGFPETWGDPGWGARYVDIIIYD